MNTPSEPNAPPQVDEQRRRLTQGALVAPVVIGTLLSRPVLGAAPHNCTLSGQMSGNVSSHEQGVCSTLGLPPSYYAGISPDAWPNATSDFLDDQGRPLLFRLAPGSQPTKWSDAFRRKLTHGINTTYEDATLWDVLKGVPVNNNNGHPINNAVLEVKPGMNSTYGLELGQEAVAAYMNAFDQTKFPVTGEQALAMFNAVIVSGGTYDPLGLNLDASQVLTYFKSLHP